jgi:uncharacterized protein (DUF885 family)
MRFLCLMLLAMCGFAQKRDAEFAHFADRYFDDFYFKYDPVAGTQVGFHQYDPLLPSLSRAEIDQQIAALKKLLPKAEAFSSQVLSPGVTADRELLISNIRSQLLELETVRQWEKNPDIYSSGVSRAIFVIMSRSYAPATVRLRAAIAREKLIPRVFESARANLKQPPKVYTEVAIQQLPGIVSFFEKDVPAAFKDVADSPLNTEFHKSNEAVIESLRGYEKFLREELLPRSNGDFRIGAEVYSKKLLYDEMVDIPLDRLLAIGYKNLRQNQAEFKKVAAQIDSSRSAQEILKESLQDHPEAGKLLGSFKDVLSGLRDFIEKHKIVTIPTAVPPIVEETPPFMRALTTASMDTPGPFEKIAKEAFFNVTLPEKSWDAKQTEEYIEGFNRGTIISTAVHEVYPGHYTQFVWIARVPSKVRKLIGCASNAEGWAHYTEQMMLDEGYGNGDPKLRLGQLQDALLRDARYIAGIQMHTGKMTMEEAVEFFVTEGYQVRPVAEKEAKRGTSDPTYLVYTLGKLEILKLRDDYRKMKGGELNLQSFHDAFLQQGFPPVKIVRRALLGNDSPVL